VESFCSGEGIGKLAGYLFPVEFPEPVGTGRLAALAAGGSEPARKVLAESARRTGQLCGLLADIFCPQVIVLGSLARYLGGAWVRLVRETFAREALPAQAAHTEIRPAGLGERLQDLSPIAPCVWRASEGRST
jgi:predicted NBD/HSP70 family sugar kinase